MEPLLQSYDYELPDELIARRPPAARDGGRLLVVGPPRRHLGVRDLPDLTRAGDVVVVNDTRVLHARLRARRSSGGAVEVLLLGTGSDSRVKALLRPSRKLSPGEVLLIGDAGRLELEERGPQGSWIVRCHPEPGTLMAAAGEVPLPPYLRRPADDRDAVRYQTVFAREAGAVAAPTAGLHLTPGLLTRLEEKGVEICTITLHVGPGTFRPVTEESLAQGRLHGERFEVPPATSQAIRACRRRGGRVIAVGTTTTRALEAATPEGEERVPCPGSSMTELFIRPGHTFRCIDALVTNFHLPRSSLLMLVSALAGRERVLEAYEQAVSAGYRFYSYGDAMFLEPEARS